ncbi:hypothetical protein [Segetibacter aerophilus]|uniref:Uncharacterized protein n=1 Tax=Segetibacter aerophilus TaxID=670293 RepID=A0A512BHH1_9BACT|nr:hypothetical protein [Segetibacter aerophilus]GEO11403.1 hypothetical protein SAE01_38990 [Segetibacter aerophilus]
MDNVNSLIIKNNRSLGVVLALISILLAFSSCNESPKFKDLIYEASQINPWLDTVQYRFLVINVFNSNIVSKQSRFSSISYAEKNDGSYENSNKPDTLKNFESKDTIITSPVAFGNIPLPIKTIIKIKDAFQKNNKDKTFGGLYFKPMISTRDHLHLTYSISPYDADAKKVYFAQAIEIDPCPPMVCATMLEQ